MSDSREMRKLPRGERCPQCGSRRFYVENGLRFCSNGDQIEGFVQFDVSEEQDAGRQGTVARREKEVREREKRRLTGQAGKNLYLEALQLLLRNQVLWMIREKSHKPELETVVRDLWDLRIRGSSALAGPDDSGGGGGGGESSATGGETELEVFSSQVGSAQENDLEEEKASMRSDVRAQSWDPARGMAWPLPRVPDTLALCYLGCLLLRIPTRIGEIHEWAATRNLPYERAWYDLPQEMRDRMPSGFIRVLKYPMRVPLTGLSLYSQIMDLALSYHMNYDMVFPPISELSMLVDMARRTALPIETIMVAKSMSSVLQCSFQFPVAKRRLSHLDHPEILLSALLLVATKLCFPFHGSSPLLKKHSVVMPFLEWEEWGRLMDKFSSDHRGPERPDYKGTTASDIASMTEEELTAFLTHVSSHIDQPNHGPATDFFPMADGPEPENAFLLRSGEQFDSNLKEVLQQALRDVPSHILAGDGSISKDHYEAFRTTDAVPAIARPFYQALADVAALSLEDMTKAAYMLERRIMLWQRRQREESEDQYGDEGE